MKLLCLFSIVLLVVCLQNIKATDPHANHNLLEEEQCQKYALAKTDRDLRGIRDVWNKIKEDAIQTWNYIKGVAEQTRAKIEFWVQSVKEYAYQIEQQFERRLEGLKQKLNDIINEIYYTGDQLKHCLAKEQENVRRFLNTVIKSMVECIYDEVEKLPNIYESPQLEFNQTKFTEELDQKVGLCERDVENIQHCIFKAREDIFYSFTRIEQDILKTHYETRGVVDEVKSTLLACSLNHIVDATNFVTNKALEVFNCVKEENIDEIEDQNKNKIE